MRAGFVYRRGRKWRAIVDELGTREERLFTSKGNA